MDQEGWGDLKGLFYGALERTGDDRAAFVVEASQKHPALADQLRALLDSHADAAEGFLETPAFVAASLEADLDDVADTPLRVGELIDQTYEVEKVLGAGGMGVVYRVTHRGLSRSFAAKVINSRVASDQSFLERFSREATALGRLKHPHIVNVTDFGVDREQARPYLVMESLEGETLAERLRSGPLALDDALPLFAEIAAAVDHAHAAGVLHLDLKPDNVFLERGPNGRTHAKILDFGLAQFVSGDRGHSASGANNPPIGTPSHIAPELLRGEHPGPPADIYSLGILFYEVLVGRCPFEGSTAEILEQQRHAEPTSPSRRNSKLPPEIDAPLNATLAKYSTERPGSAANVVSRLRAAALQAQRRLWRRAEVPRRLQLSAGIAVALSLSAPFLWRLPPVQGLERQSIDARFASAPARPPGPDILLLMLDDASLAADATPLVQRAEQFGVGLQHIFDAGARSVAVDFLLPQAWSNSEPFTRLVLRNQDALTLAAYSPASGEVIGPECIAGLTTMALGPERASALFGFINLDQDDDGVSRRARVSYHDREGGWQPSFAARAAARVRGMQGKAAPLESGEEFWIDHTIDSALFERVPWKDLDATLRNNPGRFRDRLVVVGGDFSGSGDDPRVPNRGAVPGVILQATIIDTILSGLPLKGVGDTAAMIFAGVVCALLSIFVLLGRRAVTVSSLLVLVVAAYAGGAFLLFSLANVVVPVVGPAVTWIIGAALAWGIRLRRAAYPRDHSVLSDAEMGLQSPSGEPLRA
jgi:serine/threonine protein kinase